MINQVRAFLLSMCTLGSLFAASAADDFNGYTAGGLSNVTTGDPNFNLGTGWNGGWFKANGNGTIFSGGLAPDLTTGNLMRLTSGSSDDNRRTLAVTYGSGAEAWISVYLKANVSPQNHHVDLFNGATQVFGLDSQGSSNTRWRLTGTLNSVFGSDGPALDTSVHFLVLRVDGTGNTVQGWWDRSSDPGSTLPDIPQISLGGSAAFNQLAFRVFGGGLDVDQVRVGTTFAEVAPPTTVMLSASPLNISEAGGTSTVVATLSATSAVSVVATLALSGTATSGGVDFTVGSTTLTIPAGQLSASTVVTAVQDTAIEGPETVTLTISAVTNAITAATHAATITITDDDGALAGSGSPGSSTPNRGAAVDEHGSCGSGSLAGLILGTLMIVSLRLRQWRSPN